MTFLLISFVLRTSKSENVGNEDLSKQYHDMGVKAAQSGDFKLSLGYLRSSCRLDRNNKRYWNDLGVAEMRLQDYKKAKSRFLRALKLDPKYKLAKKNMKELKSLWPSDSSSPQEGVLYEQKHDLSELPSIDPFHKSLHIATDHSTPIPLEHFALLDQPFLVRDAAMHWGWRIDQLDMNATVAMHGHQILDYYPHNMNDPNVHPYRVPFRRAYEQLEGPEDVYHDVDISEARTYIHWNVPLPDFESLLRSMSISLPSILNDTFWNVGCFNSPEQSNQFHLLTHWKMLLLGEEGAGMFNHRDYLQSASYQIQVQGRKKWHLCAPTQDPFLYQDGEVDMFNPDYKRFPQVLKAKCYQFIVEPGDFVFYPKGYWHQTLNLDTPTISLTGTLVTPTNHFDVKERLEVQCSGRGNLFIPDTVFCAQLKKCYKYWADFFDSSKLSDGNTSNLDEREEL